MLAVILSIISLILSCFGLYAFVAVLLQRSKPQHTVLVQAPTAPTASPTSISLVDMKEFNTLPPELKTLYKTIIIDNIAPKYCQRAAQDYNAYRKGKSDEDVQKELLALANMMILGPPSSSSSQQPSSSGRNMTTSEETVHLTKFEAFENSPANSSSQVLKFLNSPLAAYGLTKKPLPYM